MKRKLWCGVAVIVAAWWWHRSPAREHRAVQAAVTADGFAVVHEIDGGWRRVRELSRDGATTAEHLLAESGSLRVVGTRDGAAIGWIDGKQVKLALLEDRERSSRWGKSVRAMCDGVAANEERFGIGWLELDHSVWMVHGPTSGARALEVSDLSTAAEPAQWCGIASAGSNIALIWRDRDRLKYNLCSKARCSSTTTSTALDRREQVLGFACLRDACGFVARDPNGNTRLRFVAGSGSILWSTPIDTDASRVAMTAVGDRAFAIGYETDRGSEVIRLDRKGVRIPVWHGGKTIPALAWAAGTLLVAYDDGGGLAHKTFELQ